MIVHNPIYRQPLIASPQYFHFTPFVCTQGTTPSNSNTILKPFFSSAKLTPKEKETMAAQFPQQPLQQQQQPPVVFPNTGTNQPTQSSHSDGSFGTVFIVLAVIVVVSAIACCLSRVCNKRHNKNEPSKQHKQKNEKFRPGKEKERDGNDIESGFEKGLASKAMSNGEHQGGGRGFKTFHNGRINDISNGHPGPSNGHHGHTNGAQSAHGGHYEGETSAEPVFTVEEPKPGLAA